MTMNTPAFPDSSINFVSSFFYGRTDCFLPAGPGGCILADVMGLGKSLQTICLIDAFINFEVQNKRRTPSVSR